MTGSKAAIFDSTQVKASILLALFMVAYSVPIKAMVGIWMNNEDYSYAFLIPALAAYMLWDNRKTLNTVPVVSSWKILPFLLLFVLISIYGILGSAGSASITAMPILLLLFVAFCFGTGVAGKLIFPLGILMFMVPVPNSVELTIGTYLKAISSKLGGAMIGLLNIPVYVSGNIIDLGATQLQVVDACSGMRYIFPLMALGTAYAYFFQKTAWKQLLCIAMTIPIAVVINIFRIAITGVLTQKYGVQMAQGFFHGLSGWVLFMVAFALLFLFGRLLALFNPKDGSSTVSSGGFDGAETASSIKRGDINKAFATSIVLLLVVGGLSLSTGALPAIKIKGGIEKFPLEFAGWKGRSESVDREIVLRSGAEESFSGFYTKNDHDVVSLYVGYRSTAFLSNENFFHSPTVCLPSSGWKTIEESTHVVTGVPSFGEIKVAKMVIENLGKKELVYFWFQTKDQATQDKSMNRFHLAMHAIKRDNTHDLFIRPITTIQPGEKVEDAEKRMDGFVRDMMAELFNFLKSRQYEEV